MSSFESENVQELQRLVTLGGGVKKALARCAAGEECRMIYGDLCGAEGVLRGDGCEEGKVEIDDGEYMCKCIYMSF